MKIAISCDHVLNNSHYMSIVESFTNIYQDATIYTIAHKVGAVQGRIELHPIKSTFLSNLVDNQSKLEKLSFLVPSASKKITIPKEFDQLINFSCGLSQGFNLEGDTRVIQYIYKLPNFLSSNKAKFFNGYLNKWFINSFKKSELIICSTKEIHKFVDQHTSEKQQVYTLKPPVSIDGIPVIASKTFKYDYFVLHVEGELTDLEKQLSTIINNSNYKLYILGEQLDREQLNKYYPGAVILENMIKGEIAPLLSGSLALINLGSNFFSEFNLYSLASGRPVITIDSEGHKGFLPKRGIYFIDQNNIKSIISIFTSLEEGPFLFSSKELNKIASSYNECKFKSQFFNKMSKLGMKTPLVRD